MNHRPKKTARSETLHAFHVAAWIATVTSLLSCVDSKKKTIPPLDPSKAKIEATQEIAEVTKQPGTVTRMPLGNLYQLVKGNAALIYDVRPTLFYKMGHIPGAISFPKAHFEKELSKHEPQIQNASMNQTPVVIYCTDLACPDAIIVATQLSERGYHVSVLQGGYEAWKSATD
jgi:rhodanese-related sulfurtransferase